MINKKNKLLLLFGLILMSSVSFAAPSGQDAKDAIKSALSKYFKKGPLSLEHLAIMATHGGWPLWLSRTHEDGDQGGAAANVPEDSIPEELRKNSPIHKRAKFLEALKDSVKDGKYRDPFVSYYRQLDHAIRFMVFTTGKDKDKVDAIIAAAADLCDFVEFMFNNHQDFSISKDTLSVLILKEMHHIIYAIYITIELDPGPAHIPFPLIDMLLDLQLANGDPGDPIDERIFTYLEKILLLTPKKWDAGLSDIAKKIISIIRIGNIRYYDTFFDTPLLHRAVEADHAALVVALLEVGANRNEKNTAGLTPLDIARERGDTEVLLAFGITPSRDAAEADEIEAAGADGDNAPLSDAVLLALAGAGGTDTTLPNPVFVGGGGEGHWVDPTTGQEVNHDEAAEEETHISDDTVNALALAGAGGGAADDRNALLNLALAARGGNTAADTDDPKEEGKEPSYFCSLLAKLFAAGFAKITPHNKHE